MSDPTEETKPARGEQEDVPGRTEKKPEKALRDEGGDEGDDEDDGDADFEGEFDDDDDDSSDSDDELALGGGAAPAAGEVETEDLEGGAEAGPSSGIKKRKAGDIGEADTFGQIVAGLSGDEVDAGNIIEGGRRARRGRGDGSGKPKYTAKVEIASDEDSW